MRSSSNEVEPPRTIQIRTDDTSLSNHDVLDVSKDDDDDSSSTSSSSVGSSSTDLSSAGTYSTLFSRQDRHRKQKQAPSNAAERLYQRFEQRDAVFKSMRKRSLSSVNHMLLLQECEQEVRLLSIESLEKQIMEEMEGKKSNEQGEKLLEHVKRLRTKFLAPTFREKVELDSKIQSPEGILKTLWNVLVYEWHNSSQAFAIVLLYCVFHVALYELISGAISDSSGLIVNQDVFHFGVFLAGALMMRITGGLWDWVNEDLYCVIKFDVHNRLRLNKWDAHFLRWCRRYPFLWYGVSFLGFYLILIATYHFMFRLLDVFDQKEYLMNNLPSLEYNVSTWVSVRLADGVATRNGEIYEPPECEEEDSCSTEDFSEAMAVEDEWYMFNHTASHSYSHVLGDEAATVVSSTIFNTYFGIFGILSLFLLLRLGFDPN